MAFAEDSSPIFPPELEREIFETAAELYPETIYTPCLLLVAKRVYEWIERIKYRVVTSAEIIQACPLHLLQKAIRSNRKPADFFHARVRHLWIENFVPHDELQTILSACSGIRSLSLFHCLGPSILPSLAAMKPRHLALYLLELFTTIGSVELSHPAFTSVTHLLLFDWARDFDSFPLSNFALLPALTHLALFELKTSTGMAIFASCPNLEVLVCTCGVDYPMNQDREALPSIDDARFVCVWLTYHDYAADWVAGTSGGVDFWVRTERFVVKKRRGEIQPTSRCWIEEGDGI
ncbi:hypothetical protein FB451DRAFT_1223434 [Mycena latifolia]|nr:hypothetical protein FB451DRAFT_1223434 [Mycena latifolia]